jgi:integrase/recombinase XerD
MRRLAEAGNTTHELMAISGHKTLTEVQRYTDDADRKRLAESGMAKRQGQSMNKRVANRPAQTGKPAAKSLKNRGPNFKVALPRGLEPLFSL